MHHQTTFFYVLRHRNALHNLKRPCFVQQNSGLVLYSFILLPGVCRHLSVLVEAGQRTATPTCSTASWARNPTWSSSHFATYPPCSAQVITSMLCTGHIHHALHRTQVITSMLCTGQIHNALHRSVFGVRTIYCGICLQAAD